MAFTLGSLLLAALFFINAVAVLNEQRFLAKSTAAGGEGGGASVGQAARTSLARCGSRVGPGSGERGGEL
jgi:hypothetical protein